MVDSAAPGNPSNDLGPRLSACVKVDLKLSRLETAQYDRVRVVPETDSVGRCALSDGPGNGLFDTHVHERIVPVLQVDQPPIFHHGPSLDAAIIALTKSSG